MTTDVKPANGKPTNVNRIGLTQQRLSRRPIDALPGLRPQLDLRARSSPPPTICRCQPHQIIKISGIGCSSKTPAYFLNRSHGFNALHGRMPSVATGAIAGQPHADGDRRQRRRRHRQHRPGPVQALVRRNVPMVYIIENNGVYGLTKGQFSATADVGQQLKYAGINELPPIDLCLEALVADCGFVARSFAGDAKQVRELLKAAISYQRHGGARHHQPVRHLQQPRRLDQELCLRQGARGAHPGHRASSKSRGDHGGLRARQRVRSVKMHDGPTIKLKKLEPRLRSRPTSGARWSCWRRRAPSRSSSPACSTSTRAAPTLPDLMHLTETPLAQLPEAKLRPSREAFAKVMAELM